ncbi:hypothetical protein BJ912DRAFT_852763 [Pholiota molesta]|nr:hypothetical protein BJ912DRAFT_852763 [Pholiota molesta]
MESTHAVISGSWALYALFPTAFRPGDLDFYVSKTRRTCANLLTYVLNSKGYKAVAYGDTTYLDIDDDDSALFMVLKYAKPSGPASKSINIVISLARSEIEPILHFHSTVVMNYIAPYGLVCLYPALTFRRMGLINHREVPHRVAHCITKYRDRGFDLQTDPNAWEETRDHVCGIDPVCPNSIRHLYDDSVYFVGFETDQGLQSHEENLTWELRINCDRCSARRTWA